MSSHPSTLLDKTEKEAPLSELLPQSILKFLALFLCGQGKIYFQLPTATQFVLALDKSRATLLRSALANSHWSGSSNTKNPTDFLISDDFVSRDKTLKPTAETTNSSIKIVCAHTSSTESPIIWNLEPLNEIEILFETARGEVFEYGAESSFSKDLVSIVQKYGNASILEIANLIIHGRVDLDVAHEALRWLGRVRDTDTHGFRLWLLKHCLSSSSAKVRDGAIQGLAFLGDLAGKPALAEAAQREKNIFLRTYMEKVVATLDQKKQWASS
jgi:hypothetical protein